MSLPLLALCLTLTGDEPIPADKAAVIERQQAKAQAEVSKKYGDRKPSELSQSERAQMARDQAAAEREVLDKNGVDAKQWARESIKKDRAAYADGKARVKALEDKEKADAEAAKTARPEKEIQVQRGFSDSNPVTLEEKQGAPGEVAVESGLPPEVSAEQEMAAEQDRIANTNLFDQDGPKATGGKTGGGAKGGRGGGKRK